jgi:hypothetical protein
MDFITWYFNKHPVVSTILTMELSIMWAIYTYNLLRLVVTLSLYLTGFVLKMIVITYEKD